VLVILLQQRFEPLDECLLNTVSGRTLNAFVNKNALEIVSELKAPLEESFSDVFKDIMNNALSHMPIDIWLLDQ
jgi:hypothetical protein